METTDKEFFLTFLGVTAALVVITIVILIAANWVDTAATKEERMSQAQVGHIQARIEPVGELRLNGESAEPAPEAAPAEPAAPQQAAAAKPKSGKAVYGGICRSCHDAGVAGAPVVGNIEAWSERLEQGKEALYGSVINGKGAMPPKGGNPALSEAEIQAAVDYMIETSR